MIKKAICLMFGHKLKWHDEGSANIGARCECVRCGYEIPPVVWSDELPHPLRPAPLMPACKLPRPTEGEWQNAMLAEAKSTNELLQKLVRQGERTEIFASSATVTRRGGHVPHIPQPTDGR